MTSWPTIVLICRCSCGRDMGTPDADRWGSIALGAAQVKARADRMDWDRINRIHDTLLEGIRRLDGGPWKESAGELHSEYNEMPFWILLYDDTPPMQAHEAFRRLVTPYIDQIEPVKITVAYRRLTATTDVFVDFLQGKTEIMAATSVGQRPDSAPRSTSTVFRSADSRRP